MQPVQMSFMQLLHDDFPDPHRLAQHTRCGTEETLCHGNITAPVMAVPPVYYWFIKDYHSMPGNARGFALTSPMVCPLPVSLPDLSAAQLHIAA